MTLNPKPRSRINRTIASLTGDNLTDPQRADKLLRKFSWEDRPESAMPLGKVTWEEIK